MKSTSRYVAVIATLFAALAIGCADATSPHQDSPCVGGGTETWDHSCTTATTIRADTTTKKVP